MEPVESLVPNATLEPGLVWSGPRRAIRDRDVAAEASRHKLDKAAEVRLHLQRSAPANLRHHLRRAAIRLAVLIAGDMVAFGAIRALVRAVRDDQLLGGAVAARLHAALPAGVVNGWQYAAALFLGLVVLGNYGPGDQRRDVRRLFAACALATALPLWRPVPLNSHGAAPVFTMRYGRFGYLPSSQPAYCAPISAASGRPTSRKRVRPIIVFPETFTL